MINLPDFFILYNPSRSAFSDPFTGFACVSCILDPNGIATLYSVPMQAEQFYSEKSPTGKHGESQNYGLHTINDAAQQPKIKRVRDWTAWFGVKKGSNTTLITVLEICKRPREHFTQMLRRNLHIMVMPPPIETNVTVLNTLVNNNSNMIQHIPSTPRRIRTIRPGLSSLSLFVAKQLLALAKQTKDMCPITAEEFMDGHTAAMPCGHLFMHMAIDESFKVRPDECPLCRLPGSPTFV